MKKNRAGLKVGLWLLRAFQVKIAQMCTSEVAYTITRGAKGQEKFRKTCILLNLASFSYEKVSCFFFSKQIEEKISGLCSP